MAVSLNDVVSNSNNVGSLDNVPDMPNKNTTHISIKSINSKEFIQNDLDRDLESLKHHQVRSGQPRTVFHSTSNISHIPRTSDVPIEKALSNFRDLSTHLRVKQLKRGSLFRSGRPLLSDTNSLQMVLVSQLGIKTVIDLR